MFCPNCGTNVSDDSRFCPNCGNAIDLSSDSQHTQQPQTPSVPGQNTYGGFVEPNPAYPAANVGTPLRTDRDLITYILLCIVTCGIYGYWYVYTMAQDANIACAEDGEETPGLLPYILLSLITCGLYSYYWMYKLANRIQRNAPRYGESIQEGGSDVLLWLVLGMFTCGICAFIAMNILIKNMNTLCYGYNRTYGLQ